MKRLVLAILIVSVALVKIISNQNDFETSDLILANIEALASGESAPGTKLDCWDTVSNKGNVLQTHVTYCGTCGPTLARSWSSQSMCVTK